MQRKRKKPLPEFNISGLNVIVKDEEILKITKRLEENRSILSEPKEGWMTVSELTSEISCGWETIQKIIENNNLREEYKEEFEKIKRGSKTMIEYFSPEIKEIIKQKLKEKEPPENWINANELALEIHCAWETIQKIIKENNLREEYKEKFKESKSGSKMAEHFSPEIKEIIKQKLKEKEPPENWMTVSELALEIHCARQTIQKIIEDNNLRKEYSERFKKCGIKTKPTEYFSLEIAAIIKQKIKEKRGKNI